MLLAYAVVVHAMLDSLDPRHAITRDRPAFPGKLSARTWKSLHYKVFGTYLSEVSDGTKYIGPPK